MLYFTRQRIEAHVCICFVELKVYKELERLLKLSNISMNVGKVLALAQPIVTIQMILSQNKQIITVARTTSLQVVDSNKRMTLRTCLLDTSLRHGET